jgi:hypothetical protein
MGKLSLPNNIKSSSNISLVSLFIIILSRQILPEFMFPFILAFLSIPIIWAFYLKYRKEKLQKDGSIKKYIPFILGVIITLGIAIFYYFWSINNIIL